MPNDFKVFFISPVICSSFIHMTAIFFLLEGRKLHSIVASIFKLSGCALWDNIDVMGRNHAVRMRPICLQRLRALRIITALR